MPLPILLALTIAATPATAARVMSPDEARQWTMMARSRLADGQQRASMLKGRKKQQALTDELAGRTRLVLVPDFGLYAVYTAPDGSLHGWFPGQGAVVAGRWGVQKFSGEMISACFRYTRPGLARTGKFTADECVEAGRTLGATDVVDQWNGDVFRLAAGQVPHVKQAWEIVRP